MSIQQPQSTDKLNSPDHALSHRVFANDNSAPDQSIAVDVNGDINIKAGKNYQINGVNLITVNLAMAYAIAL